MSNPWIQHIPSALLAQIICGRQLNEGAFLLPAGVMRGIPFNLLLTLFRLSDCSYVHYIVVFHE